jgi:ribosome-associated protein
MEKEGLRALIEAGVSFDFARSGGPGGQNVNKVNTKVLARLPLAALASLGEDEVERVRQRLATRLVEGDTLQIQVQETRSQVLNRALAVERLIDLISQALVREKRRRATKPTRASRERRLDSKRRDSETKRGRSSGFSD